MTADLHKGKILFLDDETAAIKPYMVHLKSEGYTNVVHKKDVAALKDVLDENADLIFLDITGVASALDASEEGLAVLTYVKRYHPWTAVVVLSGSEFPASKAQQLVKADSCVTKASLSLASLVNITEEHLARALSPQFRNVQILNVLATQIDELNLGWYTTWQVKRIIRNARQHEGDANFDWNRLVDRTKSLLSTASNIATLLQLFVTK